MQSAQRQLYCCEPSALSAAALRGGEGERESLGDGKEDMVLTESKEERERVAGWRLALWAAKINEQATDAKSF